MLLGSIPFGLLLTRRPGSATSATIGSGNIGATNVLRTGRKGLAAATLLLDVAKGAAAVLLAGAIWPGQPQFRRSPAIGAFLGHLYPVWLQVQGGKGVATLLGIVAGCCTGRRSWSAPSSGSRLLLLTRYSSLGGMAARRLARRSPPPVSAASISPCCSLGFALLVLWKHRANIARLLAGTEPRVGKASG